MTSLKSLIVLGVGDSEPADRNIKRMHNYALEAGLSSFRADYHQIQDLPDINSDKIYVMPFFPFTFWNEHCETPKDTLLYGTSQRAYHLFCEFLSEKKAELQHKYGARLEFLIDLEKAALDRDKQATKDTLEKSSIPTPDNIRYRSTQDVIDAIGNAGIFIKCMYGSEGKGITYLSRGKWVTNYRVSDGRLGNYGVYDRWPFTDITGRVDLLESLLSTTVTVEREIVTPDIFNGMKFDVRAYSILGQVPHMFVRVNERGNVTTNVSQGARVMHHPNTGLDKTQIDLCKDLALRSSQAMGLNILGVDIMFDGEMGKVVEVQAFTGFSDIRSFDIAGHLVSSMAK